LRAGARGERDTSGSRRDESYAKRCHETLIEKADERAARVCPHSYTPPGAGGSRETVTQFSPARRVPQYGRAVTHSLRPSKDCSTKKETRSRGSLFVRRAKG